MTEKGDTLKRGIHLLGGICKEYYLKISKKETLITDGYYRRGYRTIENCKQEHDRGSY